MKCYQCGATMEQVTTDLPFKIHPHSIVIIRNRLSGSAGSATSAF
jgi:hypothetical protein